MYEVLEIVALIIGSIMFFVFLGSYLFIAISDIKDSDPVAKTMGLLGLFLIVRFFLQLDARTTIFIAVLIVIIGINFFESRIKQ